jgi:nicotinamide-nucleotide amidase
LGFDVSDLRFVTFAVRSTYSFLSLVVSKGEAESMRAEVIAIGTELLMGETINSNAAWISQELAHLGVDVYHHQTVGDNPVRISEVLHQAVNRAQLLVLTGGLGPTDDDLTVATLAHAFHQPLEEDAASLAWIESFFAQRLKTVSRRNVP